MADNRPFFLREIDAPWVMEVICERFDNAMELMTTSSVIYGGAVRDALAGLSLEGDLDITVADFETADILRNFNRSVKWILTHSGGVPVSVPQMKANKPTAKYGGGIVAMAEPKMFLKDRGYEKLPISSLSTFTALGGIQVQIVSSKAGHEDPFENAIHVARNVDLRCCALVMTQDGKILELTDGAYDDCKNHRLVMNAVTPRVDVKRTMERVKKLEERGWKNEIDFDKLRKEVTTLTARERKAEKARRRKDEERMQKTLAEREKLRAAGRQPKTLPPWETLRLSKESVRRDVLYRQIDYIGVDRFVNILQDLCEDHSITAQVYPADHKLIIETYTQHDLDILMNETWNFVTGEYGPPPQVTAKVDKPMKSPSNGLYSRSVWMKDQVKKKAPNASPWGETFQSPIENVEAKKAPQALLQKNVAYNIASGTVENWSISLTGIERGFNAQFKYGKARRVYQIIVTGQQNGMASFAMEEYELQRIGKISEERIKFMMNQMINDKGFRGYSMAVANIFFPQKGKISTNPTTEIEYSGYAQKAKLDTSTTFDDF